MRLTLYAGFIVLICLSFVASNNKNNNNNNIVLGNLAGRPEPGILTPNTNINSIDQLKLIIQSYDKRLNDMETKIETLKQSSATNLNSQSLSSVEFFVQKVLPSHTDTVSCVIQLSHDKIATGSSDKTINIWEISTGIVQFTLIGHTAAIEALLKINDQQFVSGSQDFSLKVWDLKSNGQWFNTWTLKKHTNWVTSLVKLDDSKIVSGSFDQTIKVWSTSFWNVEKTITTPSGIRTILALDSSQIAVGSSDYKIRIYDINQGLAGRLLHTMSGHTAFVRSLLKWNNSFIISGSEDTSLRMWDIKSGKLVSNLLSLENSVGALADLDNGLMAAAIWSTDSNLVVISTVDWSVKSKMTGHSNAVTSLVALSQNRLATGSADQTVMIWQAKQEQVGISPSGTAIKPFGKRKVLSDGHTDEIWCLAQINGQQLATGSKDKTVKVWDLTQGNVQYTLSHNGPVRALVKIDDQIIATALDDKTIRVWDLSTRPQPMLIKTLAGHQKEVMALAKMNSFLSSDSFIVSASWDTNINLWSTTDWSLKKTIKTPEPIRRILVLKSNQLAVVNSDSKDKDNKIRIYDVNFGQLVSTLSGTPTGLAKINALIQLNDNQIISAGVDGTLKLWNIKEATLAKTLISFGVEVWSVLNLNSNMIAVGLEAYSNNLALINATDWSVESYLTGHTKNVFALIQLSTNSIASASFDEKTIVWQL